MDFICRLLLWILLVDILFQVLSNRVSALCRVWKRPLFSQEAVATALGSLSFRAGPVSGSFFAETFASWQLSQFALYYFIYLDFLSLRVIFGNSYFHRKSFIHLNLQIWKFKITQEIEKLRYIIMTKETQLLKKGGESAYKKIRLI